MTNWIKGFIRALRENKRLKEQIRNVVADNLQLQDLQIWNIEQRVEIGHKLQVALGKNQELQNKLEDLQAIIEELQKDDRGATQLVSDLVAEIRDLKKGATCKHQEP